MEKKMEILEKKLRSYNQPKLRGIILELGKGKTIFNRIVSILERDIDELKGI